LDGLEEVKRWAGDGVKGGRADLGSWAMEKRRWAAVWELEGGSRRPGGRNEGRPRDFGNWAEKWPWAKKEVEKNNFF
jgi:hypothetical protein